MKQTTRFGFSTTPPPIEVEIAERAYYRYLERTRVPADEVNDWLEAEREVRAARGIK